MKTRRSSALLPTIAGLLFAMAAPAQQPPVVPPVVVSPPATSGGVGTPTGVTVPASSVVNAADAGQFAHTNLKILNVEAPGTPLIYGPPFPGLFYETPSSIACVYNLKTALPGCNPNNTTFNPTGGGKAIAIVDAYDDPKAFADLSFFNGQFGIAGINNDPSGFQVVYAPPGTAASCVAPSKKAPPTAKGTGWDIEESLDIEWAHAMAPGATLYLVEAQSNSYSDLFCAVILASNLVQKQGGGEISMSWGSGEFKQETSFDGAFTAPGIVYFASSGDSPGVSYPSASPYVVSVGGTSTSRNAGTGTFENENVWQVAGGGQSAFEPKPGYQGSISMATMRATPDISSDANPYTGVWVYDTLSTPTTPWYIVGGTSVSSPTWAGIVNAAGTFAASSTVELTKLYGDASGDFNDITVGSCGVYMGYMAGSGWDFCSGLGSPKTYTGK